MSADDTVPVFSSDRSIFWLTLASLTEATRIVRHPMTRGFSWSRRHRAPLLPVSASSFILSPASFQQVATRCQVQVVLEVGIGLSSVDHFFQVMMVLRLTVDRRTCLPSPVVISFCWSQIPPDGLLRPC